MLGMGRGEGGYVSEVIRLSWDVGRVYCPIHGALSMLAYGLGYILGLAELLGILQHHGQRIPSPLSGSSIGHLVPAVCTVFGRLCNLEAVEPCWRKSGVTGVITQPHFLSADTMLPWQLQVLAAIPPP